MKKVTTASGFACEVNENVFNDMELFEDLCAIEKGDLRRLPPVVGNVVGEQKAALYDHLRGPDGIVPISGVMREVREIVSLAGAKNS